MNNKIRSIAANKIRELESVLKNLSKNKLSKKYQYCLLLDIFELLGFYRAIVLNDNKKIKHFYYDLDTEVSELIPTTILNYMNNTFIEAPYYETI